MSPRIYTDDWLTLRQLQLTTGERIKVWVHQPTLQPTQVAIFLHGIKGNHTGLTSLAWGYAQQWPGVTIVVPDLPGFGESECFYSPDELLNQYQRFVKELLDTYQPQECTLVGHSFGAFLTYTYLSTHRDRRVKKAYLFGTQVTPRGISGMIMKLYRQIGNRLSKDAKRFYLYSRPLNHFESLAFIKSKRPLIRQIIAEARRKELDRKEPDMLLAVFGLMTNIDLRDLPPVEDASLVFMHGLKDIASAPGPARELAALNNAPFVGVEKTGHFLPNEEPEQCWELFRR